MSLLLICPTKIQLHYDGGTITRNIPYILQEKLLLRPLRPQYYETKFGLFNKEFDDIDWDLF